MSDANIDKKKLIKNIFFALVVWALGLIVVSIFFAAWAAALRAEWIMNVGMTLYMLASTAFFGWIIVGAFRKYMAPNGRHHNGVPHE